MSRQPPTRFGSAAGGLTRRRLLQGGALVVSAVAHRPLSASAAQPGPPLEGGRTPDPTRLGSWLAISRDGRVTAYFGKMDMGQGVDTAIAQMVADELDVHVDKVSVVLADTALTVDQGGASGSTGLQKGGVVMQHAAAEARRVLFDMAAQKLKVAVAKLQVENGEISVVDEPSRAVDYGTLIGGRALDVQLWWNGEYGNDLRVAGAARPKDPSGYQVVGRPIARRDLPGKVFARTEMVGDVTVPGMLHGRMIRPPVPGSKLRSVNERSLAGIAGARVVSRGDFLGVVAPREWDAVRAASRLEVEWLEPEHAFPTTSVDLHQHIREATPLFSEVAVDEGDLEAALARAARVIEAEYEWPLSSHARMGPATALVDAGPRAATIWTDSQKPYDTRTGVAALLGLPLDSVHAIWMPGAGSYGRSDAGDGAMDAAVLSQAVGRPVRVQWMRHEGHAWDPKGPATLVSLRAGLDGDDQVIGYHVHLKGFSRADVASRENAPSAVLAGQLLGHAPRWSPRMQHPAESYGFASKRWSAAAIAPLLARASPLRTSHLRDPMGCELHFGTESFIDELAAATGADPVAFRLRYVQEPRDRAVIEAAARAAGWHPRPSPNPAREGEVLAGRGIAYAQRNGSVNAVVAEVEVNRLTGRIWVKRFVVGADHGLVVNPRTIKRTIEGNLVQACSRTLFEEVRFDRRAVHATDWASYPILEMPDAPGSIDIVLIDRPELGPRGAGEPCTRVTPGAIANAVFDATGVRFRKAPLTPERVREALA